MENTILLLLSYSLIFVSYYVIQIASTHKALKSISESDYWLREPWKWAFEFVILFTAFSLLSSSWLLSGKIMLATAGLGACLVGVFSRFKKNLFFTIMHWLGAILIFIGLSFSGWIDFGIWWTIFFPVISTLIITIYARWIDEFIWYLEINLIYSTFIIIFSILIFQ